MEPIKVGIVGFGRSGCGIHASAIKDMRDMFDVVAIADFIPERRSHEAFPNAKPYASAEALIADPNVEMVIVSTFNSMHAPVARMALKGGKHVLCEKPFGFTTADVDSMIAEAKAAGKVLQPFQQRRFEEDFQKVRSIIRSGILGKISYIQICWDGFGRRWDWQTSRQYGGGQLYNNMPHLVDHAMELFGDGEPEVQCMVASSLSIGPAEDEVHLTLTGKDKPIIRAELMATNPYARERWCVCGTNGGLHGGTKKLEWKYVDWSKMPKRVVDMTPLEGRVYCSEMLEWTTDSWEPVTAADAGAGAKPAPGPTKQLYLSLYDAIRKGTPQLITAEAVRRRIAVLEQCYKLNGIPFPEGVIL